MAISEGSSDGDEGEDGALWFAKAAVALGGVDGDDLGVVVVGNACEGIESGAEEFVEVTGANRGEVLWGGGEEALFAEVRFGSFEAEGDGEGDG